MPVSLGCRWSHGKRLQCLPSIPESAVTPRLAPGVSAQVKWEEVGGGPHATWSLQTDSNLRISSRITFLSFHKALWEKGRASNRCEYTDRDRQGRQRETPAEACPASLTVCPPPTTPPSPCCCMASFHRPGSWYSLEAVHCERWINGNWWRFQERSLDKTPSSVSV